MLDVPTDSQPADVPRKTMVFLCSIYQKTMKEELETLPLFILYFHLGGKFKPWHTDTVILTQCVS